MVHAYLYKGEREKFLINSFLINSKMNHHIKRNLYGKCEQGISVVQCKKKMHLRLIKILRD